MWLRNEKVQSLIKCHSASKIDNCNREGEKRKKKIEKNIQKNLQNKSKHKNNKCFSWFTAIRVLPLLGVTVHLTSLGCPPTLCWSRPAVGASQILIWSYSCVFLPSISIAIRTSAFSFVGALSVLVYIPWTQSLPSSSCGFNLQLA